MGKDQGADAYLCVCPAETIQLGDRGSIWGSLGVRVGEDRGEVQKNKEQSFPMTYHCIPSSLGLVQVLMSPLLGPCLLNHLQLYSPTKVSCVTTTGFIFPWTAQMMKLTAQELSRPAWSGSDIALQTLTFWSLKQFMLQINPFIYSFYHLLMTTNEVPTLCWSLGIQSQTKCCPCSCRGLHCDPLGFSCWCTIGTVESPFQRHSIHV